MKTLSTVLAILVAFTTFSYFLFARTSEAAALKEEAKGLWRSFSGRRIKRDVSTNQTSTNQTQVRQSTKKPLTAVKGWRQTVRSTGLPASPTINITGLSEVEIERLKGNRSKVELDDNGFPKIPNNSRGTPPPSTLPLTNYTANSSSLKQNGHNTHGMVANLRDKETETQNSIPRLNTTESTASLNVSSSEPGPYAKGVKKIHNDNKRDFPSAISKHRIAIVVAFSLLLVALVFLVWYWVRRRRSGKVTISPAGGNSQRTGSVLFQAEFERRHVYPVTLRVIMDSNF